MRHWITTFLLLPLLCGCASTTESAPDSEEPKPPSDLAANQEVLHSGDYVSIRITHRDDSVEVIKVIVDSLGNTTLPRYGEWHVSGMTLDKARMDLWGIYGRWWPPKEIVVIRCQE